MTPEVTFMLYANVKDLKARLARYIRFVEEGKVVVITRHGRVVAELRAPRNGRGVPDKLWAKLRRLAEQGLMTLGSRDGRIGLRPGVPVKNPKAALRDIDEFCRERKLR